MVSVLDHVKTIKVKVIIALIVVVIATLALFQIQFIIKNNRLAMEQLDLMTKHIASRLALNLREPIWVVDEYAVKNIIDTEMLDRNIFAISIEAEGVLLKGRQRDHQWQLIDLDSRLEGDFVISKQKVERYNDNIGAITVYLTRQFVLEKQKQDLLEVLYGGVMVSVVLILLAVFVINHTILKPLKIIAKSVDDITHGNYQHNLVLEQEDELGQLADGINHMKLSLQNREKERDHALTNLEERTRELALLNSTLEKKVTQRTMLLSKMTEEAQAANKAKSIFIANMSHELRTPLNAILGFSQLMRTDPLLSKEQHENIKIIENSGVHLLHLINDILDMSSIEAGKSIVQMTSFNLIQLVEDVITMLNKRLEEKGLELVFDKPDNFPEYIISDATKIRQIILNLITNAIKYTDKGDIRITITTDNIHGKDMDVLVDVVDSGCGISAEDQKIIFNSFVQVGDADVRTGSGLGLAIVKQHIQMLKGNIAISSAVNKGSTFSITLPVTIADHAEKVIESFKGNIIGLMPGQPDYRILIGESNPHNQLLLQKILEAIGLKSRATANVQELVEIFKQWQPDLVFTCKKLTGADGNDAADKIRKLPHGENAVIILLTANTVMLDDQNKKQFPGEYDSYITKPYSKNDIYLCLEKYLGVEYQYKQYEETEPNPETIDKEILDYINADLVKGLYQATLELNIERSLELIAEINKSQPDTALVLQNMVEQYQFQALQELLSSSETTGS